MNSLLSMPGIRPIVKRSNLLKDKLPPHKSTRRQRATRLYTNNRAMTGRNDNRDAFQQMLYDCTKKQFQVIIVWKIDRFGRNREEITFNKHQVKKNGVRVEYVAENLPDSPEAVILESVLEGMAEYYSLQLAQNIRRGMAESAKKHHVIGPLPMGYKRAKDYSYEIDPDTAPIVRKIFELYASGQTMAEISRWLNSQGFTTSKGKPFTKSSLPRILSNEKYTGVYSFKNEIKEENAIPAIVDKTTFESVQQMLKENRRMPSHKWSYTDFLLTGKLFCGQCGNAMVGESGFGKCGHKYSYYSCLSKRRKLCDCDKKSVRQDTIEPLIMNEIQAILKNDKLLEFIADKTWQYYLSQDSDQEETRIIQKQIADLDKSLNNLVKSIELGVASPTIANRIDELELQKTALQAALADKELNRGFKLTKDHILYFLLRMKNLDLRNRDCQRQLIETFVNAIFLFDDRLTITFNYGGESRTITLAEMTENMQDSEFVCCTQSFTK